MTFNTNRKTETIVYVVTWLLVIALLVLDLIRARNYFSAEEFDWSILGRRSVQLLYYLILFLINNYILIPRLLLRNRYRCYFIFTALTLVGVWLCQYMQFQFDIARFHGNPHGDTPPPFRPLLTVPVFIDLICDMLIVGVNLATALVFQRYKDRFEHESLLKTNAENSLNYLKAQINPHFYMNMLNNIHGMIEINPPKAQEMVLDMSKLMRYMLYESSRPMIGLAQELAFLRNYLSIMRQRFPESKVSISAQLPDDQAVAGIRIPPLLYLVYIENAFKHGVSYREESYVSVKVEVVGQRVEFQCLNSVHDTDSTPNPGIGLHNASQRLKLIYGSAYYLDIERTSSTYAVNLSIPVNENKDPDNR